MKYEKKLFENHCRLLINIPKKIAKELNIESNEIVNVELSNNKIIITKKGA